MKRWNRRTRKNEYPVLWKKIAYTILMVFIYAAGSRILLPWAKPKGNSPEGFQVFVTGLTGADFHAGTIFSVGMMPWMIASMAVALYSCLKKEEMERRSPAWRDRLILRLTLIIALLQASVTGAGIAYREDFFLKGFPAYLASVAALTGGAFVVIWLLRRNTEKGIGGQSVFVLVNVGRSIAGKAGSDPWTLLPVVFCVAAAVLAWIFERTEVHIPVRHVFLRNDLAGDDSMVIRLSPSGMMPVMYVMTLFTVIYYGCSFLGKIFPGNRFLETAAENLNLNSWMGIAVYGILLILLTCGFAFIFINPKEVSGQMEKSGDIIPGKHPGEETREVIRQNLFRTSFIGSLMMAAVIVVPIICRRLTGSQSELYFLPTSICIAVGLVRAIGTEAGMVRRLDRYQAFL